MIKGLIRKFLNRNYRYNVILNEILPVFHSKYSITNKDSRLLKKDDELSKVMGVESQGEVPVEFHKDFDSSISRNIYKHRGDIDFAINDMSVGLIYEVKNTGYLGNRNSLYEVILVTNKYVYSKMLLSGGVILHSHDEVQRFKDMDAFEIKRQ